MDRLSKDRLYAILETAYAREYSCDEALAVFEQFISPQVRVLRLKQGMQCVSGGLTVDKIYLLVAGKCYIVKYSIDGKSIIADTMYPVQLFGLYEMLRRTPTYEATVTAATECVVLEIPARYFHQAIHQDISIALLTLEYLAGMIQHNFRRNERNLLGSGMENLLIYIHQYCTGRQLPAILPVERKTMSEELGINLRTLYRYISRLKDEGLISIERGKILVTPQQFEQLDKLVSEII